MGAQSGGFPSSVFMMSAVRFSTKRSACKHHNTLGDALHYTEINKAECMRVCAHMNHDYVD